MDILMGQIRRVFRFARRSLAGGSVVTLIVVLFAMYVGIMVWIWQNRGVQAFFPFEAETSKFQRQASTRRRGGTNTLWGQMFKWVQNLGIHGVLTILLVIGSLYQYRSQFAIVLDYFGLSFLADIIGSGGGPLPSLDEQEEDISDLPPLLEVDEKGQVIEQAVEKPQQDKFVPPDDWVVFDPQLGVILHNVRDQLSKPECASQGGGVVKRKVTPPQ
mmetsp:Transcript_24362/g.39504  ORF Transcript_24362/g.39504 Transcript_24362/m.39504 type:complete len:216 (+) Transcript_24362:1758-2405(+)